MRFISDAAGRSVGIRAEGHAGWAEHGHDVVCAAVSAVLQTAWVGLTDHAGITIDGERRAGHLHMRWSNAVAERPDVRAIVATARLGIIGIANGHRERVRVIDEREERALAVERQDVP